MLKPRLCDPDNDPVKLVLVAECAVRPVCVEQRLGVPFRENLDAGSVFQVGDNQHPVANDDVIRGTALRKKRHYFGIRVFLQLVSVGWRHQVGEPDPDFCQHHAFFEPTPVNVILNIVDHGAGDDNFMPNAFFLDDLRSPDKMRRSDVRFQPLLGDAMGDGSFRRFIAALVLFEKVGQQASAASSPHRRGRRREDRMPAASKLLHNTNQKRLTHPGSLLSRLKSVQHRVHQPSFLLP